MLQINLQFEALSLAVLPVFIYHFFFSSPVYTQKFSRLFRNNHRDKFKLLNDIEYFF